MPSTPRSDRRTRARRLGAKGGAYCEPQPWLGAQQSKSRSTQHRIASSSPLARTERPPHHRLLRRRCWPQHERRREQCGRGRCGRTGGSSALLRERLSRRSWHSPTRRPTKRRWHAQCFLGRPLASSPPALAPTSGPLLRAECGTLGNAPRHRGCSLHHTARNPRRHQARVQPRGSTAPAPLQSPRAASFLRGATTRQDSRSSCRARPAARCAVGTPRNTTRCGSWPHGVAWQPSRGGRVGYSVLFSVFPAHFRPDSKRARRAPGAHASMGFGLRGPWGAAPSFPKHFFRFLVSPASRPPRPIGIRGIASCASREKTTARRQSSRTQRRSARCRAPCSVRVLRARSTERWTLAHQTR